LDIGVLPRLDEVIFVPEGVSPHSHKPFTIFVAALILLDSLDFVRPAYLRRATL
jgi:hypothetical protein